MIISEPMDRAIRQFMSHDRYGTVRLALELLRGRVLVETGSLREYAAGGSTYVFGLAAVFVGGMLYSIDKDTKQQLRAQELLRPLKTFIAFPNGDSAEVLSKMREVGQIDLLYLDSDGPGPHEDGPPVVPEGFGYQQHSLSELRAAIPLLTDDSVILLDDDCGGSATGKPFLTRRLLRELGWVCAMDAYQSVWVSGDRR